MRAQLTITILKITFASNEGYTPRYVSYYIYEELKLQLR